MADRQIMTFFSDDSSFFLPAMFSLSFTFNFLKFLSFSYIAEYHNHRYCEKKRNPMSIRNSLMRFDH